MGQAGWLCWLWLAVADWLSGWLAVAGWLSGWLAAADWLAGWGWLSVCLSGCLWLKMPFFSSSRLAYHGVLRLQPCSVAVALERVGTASSLHPEEGVPGSHFNGIERRLVIYRWQVSDVVATKHYRR